MVILLLVNLGTALHFHVLRTVYSFSPYNYQNCVRKRARILYSPTDYRTVTIGDSLIFNQVRPPTRIGTLIILRVMLVHHLARFLFYRRFCRWYRQRLTE